jgi:glycosyltransferase involved in cell wall biosynthesis
VRILQVAHQYPPAHVGGVELYTQAISHALAARGHAVTVFCRSFTRAIPEIREERGIRIWAAYQGDWDPLRRFWSTFHAPGIVRAFRQVLDEARPEIVHIQHLMGLPTTLIDLLQQRAIPFVITLWDYWWVCANAQLLTNDSQRLCDGPGRAYLNCARCALARSGKSRWRPALPLAAGVLAWRNRRLRRILNASHALIAPTEFVRRWYCAHGAPAARLRVLTPALEDAPAPGERPAHTPVRFIYVGGLTWQKGVHVLIEAFAGVQDAAELWIAGDESADPGYVAALRARAPANVRFCGRLGRAALWETLAQVDVVAIPTLWYETFSFILSEAFAAGLPVIASRLGPLADRVRDGVDGLLVAPGDVVAWRQALQRLAEDAALRQRLRAQVRPPLSLAEHIADLERLYAEIV